MRNQMLSNFERFPFLLDLEIIIDCSKGSPNSIEDFRGWENQNDCIGGCCPIPIEVKSGAFIPSNCGLGQLLCYMERHRGVYKVEENLKGILVHYNPPSRLQDIHVWRSILTRISPHYKVNIYWFERQGWELTRTVLTSEGCMKTKTFYIAESDVVITEEDLLDIKEKLHMVEGEE